MSDETPPPSLRLKPRQRPDAGTPPAAPATAPVPAPPTAEEGKIKLKIKVPGAAVEAAAAAPSVETEKPAGAPPPFPVVAAGAPVRRLPPSVVAASARKRRIWKLLMVAAGGIAMAAAIISLAYYKFIEPPPPPPKPKPVIVHTEPDTTKAVVPANDQVERAPAPAVHPHSKPALAAVTTDLAPGVTITTESVEAETEATPAFRSFVADAKISGVFQGTPPRAFINGRLVRLGEVVDSSLGIRFDSIDPKTKNIVFKDASGATVGRLY